MKRLLIGALSLLAASSVRAAASGRVVDADGKPIAGASVCSVVQGVSKDCHSVDISGFYHLASPPSTSLFVRASGYQSLKIAAIEQSAPVVLKRAGILRVQVLDAKTHAPIPKGTVLLNYTTGEQIGASAPFNGKGVRITTLAPGDILVRAKAEGYEPGGPEAISVVEGKEAAVAISMRKLEQPAH